MNNKGSTLVAALIPTAIAIIAVTSFAHSLIKNQRTVIAFQHKAIAENQATELLDFFASFSRDELNAYLSKNPITGSTLIADRYPLCAHVNLINRTITGTPTATYLNPDPIAALPPNPLDGPIPSRKANRFYQIEVVDVASMTPKTGICDTKPTYDFISNPGDGFLVTVGVSWVDAVTNLTERVVLSTVIVR